MTPEEKREVIFVFRCRRRHRVEIPGDIAERYNGLSCAMAFLSGIESAPRDCHAFLMVEEVKTR